MMMRRAPLALALLGLCLSLCACSDSEDPAPNNTTTTAPPVVDMTPDMVVEEVNPPDPYESRYQLRFTSLRFVPAQRGTPGNSLNGILAQNFDLSLEYPALVLVDLKDINAEAGTFQLKGGAGQTTANPTTFAWDPETADSYSPGTLTAATGEIEGIIADFQFVATLVTETEPLRVVIPINDLTFTGKLAVGDAGVEIKGGALEGYITVTQAEAVQIVTPLINSSLAVVFKNLDRAEPNFDSDGDGTNDAWRLSATFDATPTTIQ